MAIETVNPLAIKQEAKASKAKSIGNGDFQPWLEAASAMEGTSSTAMGLYGDVNSSTALAMAFSGVNAVNTQSGGSIPSYSSGSMGLGYTSGAPTPGLLPSSDSAVVPGTENFSQMDMINTMNQNNLQLLELQACMQSNMQAWNTKSNILSADHRARMSIIEKFMAR